MNQRWIAGVGNLLSDEILWRARINPRALRSHDRRPHGVLVSELPAFLAPSS